MYIVCLVVLLVISFFVFMKFRQNIKWYNILIVGGMLISLSSITSTPDIGGYINYYYSVAPKYKDLGFGVVTNFFLKIGLSYYEFQFIYYCVAVMIIVYALLALTEHRATVYILYLITPYLLNVVQIRNFMVNALLILAVALCYSEKNVKKQYVKWCIIIGIAASQHAMALMYLPFIFLSKRKKAMHVLLIVAIVSSITIAVGSDSVMLAIRVLLKNIIDENRLLQYTVRVTELGYLLMWSEQLLLLCFSIIAKKLVAQKSITYRHETPIKQEKICNILQFVENFTLYGVLFFPLYVINGNYSRLMQNSLLMVYVVFAIISHYGKYRTKNDLQYHYISIIVFGMVFLLNAKPIWIDLFDNVVCPILFKRL